MAATVEDRLQALEARLRVAEDTLEILNLLNSYGPLVDSGSAAEAAALWAPGGGYNFSGGISGGTRLEAPAELVAMYQSEGHMGLVNTGVSHFTGTPKVVVKGDEASAVGYSFVVLKEGDRWFLWRGAVNEWALVRTADGWRIRERFNRTLDGGADSHAVMRRVLAQ
ncbi:MAG: nuclear transport factor 2 family protein [Sphingomonadales bacterium]|nr:nuclear transport factor 2 family protein [Sphingomonadales bacterium]